MEFFQGKNKDGFVLNGQIKFVFSDRLSVFDKVVGTIAGRGNILAKCTRIVFNYLKQNNIQTAIMDGEDNYILMKKCKPLPFEFVMRNILTGSALKRAQKGILELPEGMKCIEYSHFPEPFIEVSTKWEAKDRYDLSFEELKEIMLAAFPNMSEEVALENYFKALIQTRKISKLLTTLFTKAELLLIDGKIELGFDESDSLCLIDSFGPDEFRTIKKDSIGNLGKNELDFYDKEFIRRKLRDASKESYELILKKNGRTHVQRYEFITQKLREASERLCQQ